MNPQEIFNQLDRCTLALSKGNIEQKRLGIEKAKAEREYRIKYNQKMLKLKLEKCPSTLIQALTKNDPEVVELAMKRDIAESAYYTAISASENIRLEIEVLRSKLTWLRVEFKNS